MPAYDTEQFDPPAPVAKVKLRHPITGDTTSDVPMLLDTGADVTLLPRAYIEQIGVKPAEDKVYEVEGFDGSPKLVEVVHLELIFLGRKFKGQFLLIDLSMGILGRNILNEVSLRLDGPGRSWKELKS